MNRALLAAGVALVSAVSTIALLASPAEAHTPAFSTTCTTATLTATSYPAGTVLDITVDGKSVAHEVLAKPSYASAPAVLTTTFPGTGHVVTGSITSAGFPPFVQTVHIDACSSTSPSVTTSPSSSVSVSPTGSSSGSSSGGCSSSPSSSSSTSASASGSSSASGSPSGSCSSSPSSSTSVSATQSASTSGSSSPSASSRPSTSVEATSITKSPSPSPGGTLPHTGASSGFTLAGIVLLASGGALIGLANRRRRSL